MPRNPFVDQLDAQMLAALGDACAREALGLADLAREYWRRSSDRQADAERGFRELASRASEDREAAAHAWDVATPTDGEAA